MIEPGRIPKARCIPHPIRQVFSNLLRNAAEPIDGDGTIAAKTRAGRGRVIVEASDRGRGIAADFLKRLWEPFQTT